MYRDIYFFDISNLFILQSLFYCIHPNFLILFPMTLDMYFYLMNIIIVNWVPMLLKD